ncbi:M15 family metallopeptidase [Enterococcus faecium]|uniref:M15 family metallopeptidase n=1 Tax=Enterococcus faecium TaxID=1352 RepID=UPI003D31E3C0
MAESLLKAKELAATQGYGLLLWDGYRPNRAVNCFMQWAAQPENNLTKESYYPNIDRTEMISKDTWLQNQAIAAAVPLILRFID